MNVTVVITSCGRPEKLKETLRTFEQFNTYPVQYILVEDSGDKNKRDQILDMLSTDTLCLFHDKNMGQIASIDEAYSYVETPFIFHLEDDWLFFREGFIEKSLTILENKKDILQVWLRDRNDTNKHPVEQEIYDIGGVEYSLMSKGALGGSWDGFSWNPGLRRLEDYRLIAPFIQYRQQGDFNALTECRIGLKYREYGFRAAILSEGYTKHMI